MGSMASSFGRRKFIRQSATVTAGLLGLSGLNQSLLANENPADESLFVIGPMEGYSPQIGSTGINVKL